jgi:diguanylate cyclase (GGDEF)-like protein
MEYAYSLQRYLAYTRAACLLVFTIALVVTIGWMQKLPLLSAFQPDYYHMKSESAACFIATAISLWLLTAWRQTAQVRIAGMLSAAAVTLLALLTIGQEVTAWEKALEYIFLGKAAASTGAGQEGMSDVTAASFVVVGLTLLLLHRRNPPGWVQYLSAATLLLWIGIAIFHLYGLNALYASGSFGSISIPTICCFIVLSSGVLLSRPSLGFMALFTNSRFGGIAARRLIPAALLIPVCFGWLLVWSRLNGAVDIRVGAAAQAISFFIIFVLLIAWTSRSILRLERLVLMKQHERMQALERAAHLAHYDVLTNLPNRALLRERMQSAIKLAARKHGKVALLFLDLDRFKPVNDTYGHETGDQVLVEVAARLLQSVRDTDTVSRQGGDEFVILLQDIVDVDDIARIASTVLTSIERPFVVNGSELFLAGSIGISIYPNDGEDIQLLIDHADAAMYYAKSLGRKNYQFFAPHINELAMRRSLIERQIRTALAEDQFMLYYQPKVDIASGKLIGAEALIRMRNDDGKPFSPDHFIAVAEEAGLIIPIGKWVMQEACRQLRVWQEAGYPTIPISINISAAQFQERNFVDFVQDMLEDSSIDAGCLDIEVTETTAMQDFEHSIATMKALRKLGVSLSIDDFGTGYSSLSYLKRFAIDSLKIDRSFIQDLPANSEDAAITCAIIDMAKNLKQKVIAEGVENKEQLQFLKEQGCDQVQGYYFSEPLAAESFEVKFFDEAANEAQHGTAHNAA